MTVAAARRDIKRRVDYYLWEDKSPPNKRLRGIIENELSQFDRLAIVGGMVRDLARAGKRGFHSDIDLVIDAPVDAVTAFAEGKGARSNSFGGYSYHTDGWKVDFWALEKTWALTEGHVAVQGVEDITRCTFFDCDAIVYDVKDRKVACSDTYLDKMRDGTIDICLSATPSVTGNLYRAIRRLFLWDVTPGPSLQAFIAKNLNDDRFDAMVRVDRSKGLEPLIGRFESADVLKACVNSRGDRHRYSTYFAEQLVLPGFPNA